jgi:hypothetical protein
MRCDHLDSGTSWTIRRLTRFAIILQHIHKFPFLDILSAGINPHF